ncbi:MAG: asnB [Bacteroidetes bacterium]|nr:asnB [Bacteroidota bacterium]
MCGIAGFINNSLSEENKKALNYKMLGSIIHRGPENSSVWCEGIVSLGQNRLKIIDLSDAANQPFDYMDLVIIFNGEMYNYIEVREELIKLGYKFRTQGDTEVLGAAYKEWGDACVTHFIGMWSLAIWDTTKRRLFCSRDRFGIKPFYYISRSNDLYFASEYKALKQLPDFDNTLNEEQVQRGIAMLWAVYKDETYYRSVSNLMPAHNLVYENGKITISKYWDIDFSQAKSTLSWSDKKDQFYQLFEESIKLHSRSDVQNGTCLSGGLDSSAISSVYSTLYPDSRIKSFSIYYEGNNAVDERPFVKEVVRKYPNIDPYYFTPTDQDIADSFHNVAYHADVPLLGSSYLSQYFLMKLAKSKGVTVVLDGQGSDEYLGGYLHSFYRLLAQDVSDLHIGDAVKTFSAHLSREHYGFGKSLDILAKSAASLLYDENGIYNLELSRKNSFFNTSTSISLEKKSDDRMDNFLYHLLFNTTLQTLLHFEDRNSMAFSLESRVPFLDHKLIEFAFSLRNADKINNKAETKYILRESLHKVLPQAVYERKDKKGFVTPGEVRWLNGPLKFLLDVDYSRLAFMDQGKVKNEIEKYKKGDVSNASFVWRILCLHYWLKEFN